MLKTKYSNLKDFVVVFVFSPNCHLFKFLSEDSGLPPYIPTTFYQNLYPGHETDNGAGGEL